MIKKNKIKIIYLEKELKKSYLDYAMSVIINRAIPDIRDGLKPVHRRILYAMYILKNNYYNPYKKSARIVGDVIGKYHPHGDNAVYESIVRMIQKFSIRYPLIDGQGNFGSIDGDSAAAMRYTEIRMSKITEEFLNDIEKKTINFSYNYDDTQKIPNILPTKIPNILINGTTGIAVGMATNIPPHNLTEVMNAFIYVLKNNNISTKKLMKYIKGPDFPTGGIIENKKKIYQAYKNGKGTIKITAKIKKEKNKKNNKKYIVINELPYQINKSKLINKIIQLIKDKKIEGISHIRDESDKDGMRIVIETKKGIKRTILINKLLFSTNLQTSYGINMIALYKKKPKLFNLKQIINIFINHRKKIIINKILFKLNKYKKQLNILEGFLITLNNIEKILFIIKNSKNKHIAQNNIINKIWNINFKEFKYKKYIFTIKQIKYILKLSLSKLTTTEKNKTYKKYIYIKNKIKKYNNIIINPNLINNIIKKEFIYIKNKFGDKRITKINNKKKILKTYDFIKKENIIIILTKQGYIKSHYLHKFNIQKRGGKGKKIIKLKNDDYIINTIKTNTHLNLLAFSNKGKIFYINILNIIYKINNPTGKPIVNFIKLLKNEKITCLIKIKNNKLLNNILLITNKGLIKKININNINIKRNNGIKIIKLKKNNKIINAYITNNNNDIMIFTKKGKTVRFPEKYIRNMGKNASGIKGIKLLENDNVTCSLILKEKYTQGFIIIITNNGYGKKTLIKEFPSKSRAQKGILSIKINKKNSFLSKCIYTKNDKKQLLIVTNKGNLLRIYVKNITTLKRNTQGLILMRLNNNKEKIQNINLI